MDIDAAMEKAQADLEAKAESVEMPEPSETAAEPAPEPVEPAPAEPAHVEEKPEPGRARDDEGKFTKAPKPKPAPKPAAVAVKGTAGGLDPKAPAADGSAAGAALSPAPVAPPVPAQKAPQSWTPAAREAFAKAPPEVQAEAIRREREISSALQSAAEDRRVASHVRASLAPYESLARASGQDAITYAGTVLQTAAALQMGSPQQKAALVANILSTYGVDVEMVNAHLQGQAPQQPPQQQPQDIQRLVQQAIQQQMGQASEDKARKAWADFQATAPEFLDDVKDDMRAILTAAAESSDPAIGNMTYQDAYTRACRMNEKVAAVLDQRKAAQARTGTPVTPAARAAAASVKTQPSASKPGAQTKGIDAAMKRAAKDLGMDM